MSDRLTIVMALKDRVPFTLRWMRFANEERYPFRIILADGGTDTSAAELFNVKSDFPNLNYEYIRYPADENYTIFYKKISDALALVDTPYVLMADNDDFFCVDGLMKSISFLDENPDFVSARGNYQGFSVKESDAERDANVSGLYGKTKLRGLVYSSKSITQEMAADRLTCFFSAWAPNWYNVHRLEYFCECWNQIRAFDIKDIFFMEHALSGLLVTKGKFFCGHHPYYYRQMSGGYLTTSKEAIARDGDVFDRMLSERWTEKYWLAVCALACSLQAEDGIDAEAAKKTVQLAYRQFVAPLVVTALSSHGKKSKINKYIKIIIRLIKNFFRIKQALEKKRINDADWYFPQIKRFLQR